MKRATPTIFTLALLAAVAFVASFTALRPTAQGAGEEQARVREGGRIDRKALDAVLSGWPDKTRQAASSLLEKYGAPAEATESLLIWRNNGPWKYTILYRDPVAHAFPAPHSDFLESFVDYRVPTDKFDELAAYDGSVIAERTKGELSARCDHEEMNFLALNLANDVATGKRSVAEARRFYAETAQDFARGRMSPYVQRLQFEIARGKTADPDHATRIEETPEERPMQPGGMPLPEPRPLRQPQPLEAPPM